MTSATPKSSYANTSRAGIVMQTSLTAYQSLVRRALIVLLGLIVSAAPSAALSPNGASEVIQSTIETLRSALRQKMTAANPLNPAEVSALVDQIVLPHIDLGRSGRLILGRHWRTASAAERQAFIASFQRFTHFPGVPRMKMAVRPCIARDSPAVSL